MNTIDRLTVEFKALQIAFKAMAAAIPNKEIARAEYLRNLAQTEADTLAMTVPDEAVEELVQAMRRYLPLFDPASGGA